jgi:small conductance mechanosensitive channel
VVEAVTLRIVRLRAYDGQVHTIPYSKISTISNLTKDYSYYVFDISVAYKEDVDRVMRVMSEVGAQMQRERAYRRLIVEPLEIAGVDRFAENAVVVRARMKTRPLQQWTVGREYNRRLKKRFDELGIEIPFPQRTLHVATPAAIFPDGAKPVPAGGAPDGVAANAAEGR